MASTTPVIDLHCDLLSYLTRPETQLTDADEIGCALPWLKDGNVKLQVMAIFAPTEKNSHDFGLRQSEIFRRLGESNTDLYHFNQRHLPTFADNNKLGILAAVENASAFCDEDMTLKEGFQNLERLRENVGTVFYLGFTHHAENRFGGGNFSAAGLKNDGCALLDYLHGQQIAVDLSHTSDALAYGILDYITKQNLDISVLASHSNYRRVYHHARNLPDELAQEVIHRRGLIGLNFVRAFVNPDEAGALQQHLAHAIQLGGEKAVAFGADFFYTKSHPDKSRVPFYFPEHENAARYPAILETVQQQFGTPLADDLAFKNTLEFMTRLWSASTSPEIPAMTH